MHLAATHDSEPLETPLSLYVHIPWCVKKCPYCDFNSHTRSKPLPIEEYVTALIEDLSADSHFAQGRKICSIFFGGGTPSLFPAGAIAQVIDAASHHIGLKNDVEITLEANPGTTEHTDFTELRRAGVNRLSLGIQSFNPKHLVALGRIHSDKEARAAIDSAMQGGFTNVNLDLMFGLPGQTVQNAMDDLEQANNFNSSHLSWYQLTIERNTAFYSQPPITPDHDYLQDIYTHGTRYLDEHGLKRYEVSAYARNNLVCRHNINYWEFGDYIGIGAGAHGKISTLKGVTRTNKTRIPDDYIHKTGKAKFGQQVLVDKQSLALEFMLNSLRLCAGVPTRYFEHRTAIKLDQIKTKLNKMKKMGLIEDFTRQLKTTEKGFLFLDYILEEFASE